MTIALMSWLVAIPLLGVAGGLRTMMAMAVLCWFARFGLLPVAGTWAFWAAQPITAIVFTILAMGELIGDKLPQTPSRVSLLPLVARICFGGVVGAICATGLRGAPAEGAILGVLGAVVGAFGGFNLRQWMVKTKGFRDLPVALAEDAVAVGLSVLALGIVTG